MLGPALAHLFVDLDKRRERLTPFEKAVHRELFELLQLGRRLADPASFKSLAAGIDRRTDLGSRFGIDSDSGEWTGSGELQSGCEDPNCWVKNRAN